MNCSLFPDISGINATEMELIRVPGMVIRGRTIPVIIPKTLTDSFKFNPVLTRTAGNIKEIRKLTIFEPIRIIAIGADSIKSGLIWFKFGFIFPPLIKYRIIARMLDKTQAIE